MLDGSALVKASTASLFTGVYEHFLRAAMRRDLSYFMRTMKDGFKDLFSHVAARYGTKGGRKQLWDELGGAVKVDDQAELAATAGRSKLLKAAHRTISAPVQGLRELDRAYISFYDQMAGSNTFYDMVYELSKKGNSFEEIKKTVGKAMARPLEHLDVYAKFQANRVESIKRLLFMAKEMPDAPPLAKIGWGIDKIAKWLNLSLIHI